MVEAGKYIDAYEALISLNGYKDSAAKASEIFEQYEIEKLKIAEGGDIVFFGTYEQDNDISNGNENIEWLVLAKESDKVFVLSRYALDFQQYNTSVTDVTWETCSLRKWLNGTFIRNAFSAAEQDMIQNTTVTAVKNPMYNRPAGNNTTDKVLLLGIYDLYEYIKTDEAKECIATDYAIAQAASKGRTSGKATCWWWSRTTGAYQECAAVFEYSGSANFIGYRLDNIGGIRPAMWVSFE